MFWKRLTQLAIALLIAGFVLYLGSGIRMKHDIPPMASIAAGMMAVAAILLPVSLIARDLTARKARRISKKPPA
jgi:hypothetical protein